ncbi:MAG: hypothetical protein ACXWWV_10940 [Candidatus Deferrimicrobiaceae bacterium]
MIHGSILHRVAITGIGIVSRLGNIKRVGKARRRGESGVVSGPGREKVGFRSPLPDAIRDFDARDHLPEKQQRKTMTGFAVQAYVASTDAIRMSRLTIALDGMRETAGESGKRGTGS